MARIKNTTRYPFKGAPIGDDFLIGSDSQNNGKSVNFRISDIVALAVAGGTDTFATLNGNILTLPDGQTYDLTPTIDTDTNTFATLAGTIITFEDGSVIDSTIGNAVLNGNIITFGDGQTADITPVVDTDTDTFAVLSGGTITFPDGQTITIPAGSTDDQIASEVPISPITGLVATQVQEALVALLAQIPNQTSDLINDGNNGTDPFITASSLASYTIDINANILRLLSGGNPVSTVDLSLYLDDTNLARLVSGVLDANTGIVTFTRDDSSTFDIDFSALLGGITIDSAFSPTSINALENQVIRNEFSVLEGVSSQRPVNHAYRLGMAFNASYKILDTDTDQISANNITFDREVIIANIGGTNYVLMSKGGFDGLSYLQTDVLDNTGSVIKMSLFSYGNIILLNYRDYSLTNEIIFENTPVTVSGTLPTGYEAFELIQGTNIVASTIDVPLSTDTRNTIFVLRSSNSGSTITVDNTLSDTSVNPVENQVIEDTFQRTILAATQEPLYRNPFTSFSYKRNSSVTSSLLGVTADANVIMINSTTINTSDWYMLIEDSFLASNGLLSEYFSNSGSLIHFHMGDVAQVFGTSIEHVQRLLSIVINTTPVTDFTDIPAGYTLYKEENIINSIIAGSSVSSLKTFNINLVNQGIPDGFWGERRSYRVEYDMSQFDTEVFPGGLNNVVVFGLPQFNNGTITPPLNSGDNLVIHGIKVLCNVTNPTPPLGGYYSSDRNLGVIIGTSGNLDLFSESITYDINISQNGKRIILNSNVGGVTFGGIPAVRLTDGDSTGSVPLTDLEGSFILDVEYSIVNDADI